MIKIFLVLTLAFLVWVLFVEHNILRTTSYTLSFPAKKRLSIVALSDWHCGWPPLRTRFFTKKLTNRVVSIKPDFVFLLGDFLTSLPQKPFSPSCLSWLKALKDELPNTKFVAVFGNHDFSHPDFSKLKETLKNWDIEVLDNNSFTLSEAGFNVVGISDALSGHNLEEKAFSDIDPTLPVIVLSHSPDILTSKRVLKTDLVVLGHTHAGQIRLPLIGALIVPGRFGRKYDHGLFKVGSAKVVIGAGLGVSGPPIRLLAFPEVVSIILEPQER